MDVVLLAIFYALFSLGGSLVASTYGNASPLWPASGLGIWWLARHGWRNWPGLLVGALAARSLQSEPILVTLSIGVGNVLEAVAGAWLLLLVRTRLTGTGFQLLLPAKTAVAAVAAPCLSATIGTVTLVWSGIIPAMAWVQVGFTWWIGDVIGIFLLFPFLEALSSFAAERRTTPLLHSLQLWSTIGMALAGGLVTWLVRNPRTSVGTERLYLGDRS